MLPGLSSQRRTVWFMRTPVGLLRMMRKSRLKSLVDCMPMTRVRGPSSRGQKLSNGYHTRDIAQIETQVKSCCCIMVASMKTPSAGFDIAIGKLEVSVASARHGVPVKKIFRLKKSHAGMNILCHI